MKHTKPLADLVHAHVGRPAFIMCGGETLPADMARAPENAVFISANQHGCLLRRCDYIAAADSIENKEFRTLDGGKARLRDFGVPIVSGRRPLADYRIFKAPINNTGVIAAWLAWVMGCAPIILGGVTCYQGGTYYHDAKAQSSGRSVPLSGHLGKWRSLPQHAPGAMLRAMNGPLIVHKVFPAYDPAEPAAPVTAAEQILAAVRGKRVVVTNRFRLPPYWYEPGEEIEVNYSEFQRGMREKKLRELAA